MSPSTNYKKPAISTSVIKRLPRYRRFLRDLRADGITRISSKDLAHRMNLTANSIFVNPKF